MLINQAANGKRVYQPPYETFKWLAMTFGSRPYRAFPVGVKPETGVTAYGIELQDSGDRYIAVWQNGLELAPKKEVWISVPKGNPTTHEVQLLNTLGRPIDASVGAEGTGWRVTLPEVSGKMEAVPFLARIHLKGKP